MMLKYSEKLLCKIRRDIKLNCTIKRFPQKKTQQIRTEIKQTGKTKQTRAKNNLEARINKKK